MEGSKISHFFKSLLLRAIVNLNNGITFLYIRNFCLYKLL